MSDQILLRVTAVSDPYDSDGFVSEMKHEEVTFESLLKEMSGPMLAGYGLIRVDPKKGLDKDGINTLSQYGWVNAKASERREKNIKYTDDYYMQGSGIYSIRKTNLDTLKPHEIDDLAKGSILLQRVELKSVLSSAEFKKYQAAVEQIQKRTAAAAARRLANVDKRKQKKLDAAKRVLEEAGLTVKKS